MRLRHSLFDATKDDRWNLRGTRGHAAVFRASAHGRGLLRRVAGRCDYGVPTALLST